MEISEDPMRLLPESKATEFLGLPSGALAWRERRGELAIPVVRISARARRYRYGDLLLVSTGKRPLIKPVNAPCWESPYTSSEVA